MNMNMHMNRRTTMTRTVAIVRAAALAILAASVVWAGSVHLKGGANAEPTFDDEGVTLSSTGALAGLGNGDILVIISATANPTANCCNPGGECKVPGQNPAPVNVTGSQSIPESEFKNGNVTFNVETNPPASPVPGAPDCPNTSWTESITDMAFTSATITVMQGGVTVFTTSCTFSSPTSDGRVPSRNVTCS
jgi:hypothetical protein